MISDVVHALPSTYVLLSCEMGRFITWGHAYRTSALAAPGRWLLGRIEVGLKEKKKHFLQACLSYPFALDQALSNHTHLAKVARSKTSQVVPSSSDHFRKIKLASTHLGPLPPAKEPLSSHSITVPIGLSLRGSNIHSRTARDNSETTIYTIEVASGTSGVADLGDAQIVV